MSCLILPYVLEPPATTPPRCACLRRPGCEVVGTETSYPSAPGIEIEETILRLAQPVRSRLNDAWLPDSDVDTQMSWAGPRPGASSSEGSPRRSSSMLR